MKLKPAMKGILWMALAQTAFVVAWSCVKLVGERIPVFEITFFRSAISVVLIVPLVHLRRGSLRGRAVKNLLLRSAFGTAAMLLSFYAMIHMDLGNATTLFNTMPIFVALLAPAMIGEPFERKQLLLILGGFAGIALVLRADAGIFEGLGLMAVGAGFLAAIAMIFVRKLTSTDSVFVVTFFFTGFAALVSLPVAAIGYVAPTPHEWALIALIGIAATLGQILLVHAYRFGHAATIAPFAYVSVVGSYVSGVLIFGAIPDIQSIAGAAIVIGCGAGIMLFAPAARQAAKVRT
ncbi:MAG TPA: DMT family transporter [bacterium]|nr:DMT family transporter [bacterium]